MTELPNSWTTCPIGEVLVSVEMTAKDEPDREIWYVDISSIDNQSNKVVDPKRMTLSAAPSRARQKIIAGDTLFSTVRPYLRKIAAVPEKYDGENASTGFAVLRPAGEDLSSEDLRRLRELTHELDGYGFRYQVRDPEEAKRLHQMLSSDDRSDLETPGSLDDEAKAERLVREALSPKNDGGDSEGS